MNKIRNKKRKITTDTEEMQKVLREHYEQLYVKKIQQPVSF